MVSKEMKAIAAEQAAVLREVAKESPERAALLTDRKLHKITKARQVVDGDCDYVEWGDVWTVWWHGPNGRVPVGCGEREDCEYLVYARCSALNPELDSPDYVHRGSRELQERGFVRRNRCGDAK